MNPQICLSLEKIQFPQHLQHLNTITIYILTDSSFQHLIPNKLIKNHTVHFFGQKMFIPHSTKQILFDVCSSKHYHPSLRVCSFTYRIPDLNLNYQNQVITECNQFYNDFSFLFSIKLSAGTQTNTQIGTLSEFSSFQKFQQLDQKHVKMLEIMIDEEKIRIPRLYSPKNMSLKLLDSVNEDSWEVKSEQSPSKKKKHILNESEKDWDEIEKKSTSQSLTLQSQSFKKLPMSIHTKKPTNIALMKLRKAKVTQEGQEPKKEVHKISRLGALTQYRDFLLFGGIVGIFTAVLSTELLIL